MVDGAAGQGMASSEQSAAADERPVSSPGSGSLAGVPGRLPIRQFVAKLAVNRAAYTRLHTELAAARPEFELLVERADAAGASWVEYGRERLTAAETALRRGAIEASWRHLHTARRLEVYGLERLDETREDDSGRSNLAVRAATVREEALDTLDGWRRRAVVALLCDEQEALREEVTGAELRAATRILQEHYEGVYLLRSERQRQFNQLALLGAGAGLTLFLLSLADWVWNGADGLAGLVAAFLETPFGPGDVALTAPGFALFVSVVGVMGAALFGMRSLRHQSRPGKIPQQINQLTVTSARGVIGAISALLFYFVLQTPLVQDGTILAAGAVTAPMVVVVGFAAGYTERMAPNVVATVASITETGTGDARDAES